MPQFDADSAYRYVKAQVDFGPRVPNTAAHKACGEYLAKKLEQFGATVYNQQADLIAYDGTLLKARNIIGSYKPETKKRIVLLSHWDSRPWADADPDETKRHTPILGANDGASGVGVLLEIARQLHKQLPELGIDIAKAGYLPTISLSAGIGTNHTSGSDFTFGEQVKNGWNNSIGVSVSVPIFNNRQTKSAVQKAKLQRETSLLSLLDEQKTLYKTIEGLWLDANSAQQRYAAANEKLKSTQISYDLISEQFDLGMKNTVELLTEKNNLLQAQQEQLQAKYMAILNTQLLKFYQGDKLAL